MEILRHTVLVSIFNHTPLFCNILSGRFSRWDQFCQLYRWCVWQTQACLSVSTIITLVPGFDFFYLDDLKASMTNCIFQRWLQDLLSHICSSRTLLLTHRQGHTISPSLESVWFCDLSISIRILWKELNVASKTESESLTQLLLVFWNACTLLEVLSHPDRSQTPFRQRSCKEVEPYVADTNRCSSRQSSSSIPGSPETGQVSEQAFMWSHPPAIDPPITPAAFKSWGQTSWTMNEAKPAMLNMHKLNILNMLSVFLTHRIHEYFKLLCLRKISYAATVTGRAS